MSIKRYDIVLLNSLKETNGSVQRNSSYRPYIVISNDKNNEFSSIVIVLPLTSKHKKKLPVHAYIRSRDSGLRCPSTVLCEQPMTVAKEDVIKVIGSVKNEIERKSINQCVMNAFFFGEDNIIGGGKYEYF